MACTVVSLNVCSAVRSNRISLLMDFVRSTSADIYLLQETQADTSITIRIPGYNIFRGDVRRGWGGTAIVIRNNIPIRNLRITRDPVHSTTIECRLSGTWHRFSSIYFPHGVLDSQSIGKFFDDNPNTFFGGDVNARHTSFGDRSDNPYGIILRSLADSTDIRVFTSASPTCFRSVGGSFIDKFLSNSSISPDGLVSTIPSFSDHSAIRCSVALTVPNMDTLRPRLRLFNKANPLHVNAFVRRGLSGLALPLESNLREGDCEGAAVSIGGIFDSAVRKFVPTTAHSQHRVLFSAATLALQRESKRLQRKLFSLGPLAPARQVAPLVLRLRLLRGMILNSVRHETGKFFSNIFNSISDSREAYKAVRQFTGLGRTTGFNGALFTDGSKTESVAGDDNVADCLAERFAANHQLTADLNSEYEEGVRESIRSLDQSNTFIPFGGHVLPGIVDSRALALANDWLPPESRGVLTSAEEVAEVIRTRPNKGSTGTDNMPYSLIRRFDARVILQLTIFFNHLLAIAYFPRVWQLALITPIPKPGKDTTLVENWRPISLLCCVAKIFERILAIRLNRHRDSLNLLRNQFGFLGGNSTSHALARLQADVNDGLNRGQITTVVALDLRAAFDTIWHDGLLHKMLLLRFPVHIIRLIRSMLGFRRFVVQVNGRQSKIHAMPAGVPQGSVLGPLLFILYVHDIPLHSRITVTQFADDTTLHVVHSDPARTQGMLNFFLVRLAKFFANWKLVLNANKSELLHIMGLVRDTGRSLRRRVRLMRIRVGGQVLPARNDIRLLGVQFQTNNRFTKHVSIRLAKAKRSRYHLNRLLRNSVIPSRLKVQMYKLYVRSVLMHAAPVWCRQPQVTSHQMELMRAFERGCLRSAANIRRDRGSYRHVRVSRVYETAACMRIDRYVALAHINFYHRCALVNDDKFGSLMRRFGTGGPYGSMPQLLDLHEGGRLVVNDEMRMFNTRLNGRPGLVYNFG